MKNFEVKYTMNEVEVYYCGEYVKTIDLSQAAISQWTDECVAQGGSEEDTVNEWITLEANEIYDGLQVQVSTEDYLNLIDQLHSECSGSIERAYGFSKGE